MRDTKILIADYENGVRAETNDILVNIEAI